ncbi:hypothetical protein LS482_12130 [Sinomicrobium kalidii]|nr:hypothetical protein [Sinomicrobium kalidii]UGU14449.1 hypothetical protein LS482_12130 [Sinomicrobium kalidii]
MSKSQLNDFLGVKSFDALNTDSILGGYTDKEKEKKKKKKIEAEIEVDL